jgi:hypothetical protein
MSHQRPRFSESGVRVKSRLVNYQRTSGASRTARRSGSRLERRRARAGLELPLFPNAHTEAPVWHSRIPNVRDHVGARRECRHGTLSQIERGKSFGKWGGPHMRDRPKRSAGFNTRDPSLLACSI